MIESISYKGMKDVLKSKYPNKNKTFAILLVKPTSTAVAQEILGNLTYFHHRSMNTLDIFLPGYGADWGDFVPDAKNVCRLDNTDWSYSSKYFVDFINELEKVSRFKYRGGSELILLDFKDNDICFDKVVRVKLNKAIRDGAIDSVEEFIESVIRKFIKSTSIDHVSDCLTLAELGRSIADELKQQFAILRLLQRSRHYTLANYSKK